MKVHRYAPRWVAVAALAAVALAAVVASLGPAGAKLVAEQAAGIGTCTTDGNGYCTVPHDLGSVPAAVLVTPRSPINGNSIFAQAIADSYTATTFRVRAFRQTGAVLASSPITMAWLALRSATAPSTSPTASASPSPSASPSETAGPSPSASESPAPSESPSPSPTTPLTGCFPKLAACGYPHPGNTGVPAGTTLTAYIGPNVISTAGMVIDGKQINTWLEIRAANVTIKNSRITDGSKAYQTVTVNGGSLTVEDTEVNCVDNGGTGISGSNYTARRLHVHECENGFHTGSNILIEDSYLTGVREVNPDRHGDGIQGSSASNVTVRHNTFDILNPITSSIIWDNLTISNVLVENNFFSAGAYTVYCPTGGSSLTYRGNRFYGPEKNWQSDPHRPAFGFSDGCNAARITWSGNYRDDTLAPVAAS